jgi:hypothetical protein
MRFGAVFLFVVAGVVALVVRSAGHVAGDLVMRALGDYWVTAVAGLFLVAAIWEVARPRRKAERPPPRIQGELDWVEAQPCVDEPDRFVNRFDRPRSDPPAGSVRVER